MNKITNKINNSHQDALFGRLECFWGLVLGKDFYNRSAH